MKETSCDVIVCDPAFEAAVRSGLRKKQKIIPARFLYDHRGSELFEAITNLPEYYPTRTEIALLQAHGAEIASLTGNGRVVVEFGSGSSAKTPLVLTQVRPVAYVPVDISAEFLRHSAAAIADAYPEIEVLPVASDFAGPLSLLQQLAGRRALGFFPGSTLGNFGHSAAVDLLRGFGTILGPEAQLLVGIDLRKNPRMLEVAYDDSAGVTAEFNRNVLRRINRELAGTIDVEAFEHAVVWNDALGRIEMHLVAQRDITFHAAGERFQMHEGETIHTENSFKYTLEEMRLLARVSGWEPLSVWVDEESLFSLQIWRKPLQQVQP